MTRTSFLRNVLSLCLIFGSSSVVHAQPTWSPASMIKFKRVGGTAISPDGKLVAYTISTPQMDSEKSEFLTHVWIASTDGKMNRQFTFGEKSCTNPQFSPDGDALAFTSTRGKDSKNQLYVLPLGGGEADMLTAVKSGVSTYAWSPDGKRIAFTMTDATTDKEEKDKKEKRDMRVVDADVKYAHLYTVGLQKNAKGDYPVKRLTSGNFSVSDFDWSPDSKTIAFSHQRTPSPDVWMTNDISTVPSDSGAMTALVTMKGFDSGVKYSPDGKFLAFSSDGGVVKWASQANYFIIPAKGGEPRKLAATPDENRGNVLAWSSDSKSIYVAESNRTSTHVFSIPIDGKAPVVLTTKQGVFGGASFSATGSMMSFIYQTAELAPDVYVSSINSLSPKKLSDANPEFAKLPMGKTEVLTWKSKDGMEIEGLLTYPLGYEKGKKYPLILNVHGGPAGVFAQNYTGASNIYPIQAFAAQGYAVLRPNPRGSSGYGAAFRQANLSDWGGKDYEDLMTGVDKVIDLGVAHIDSLVVTGWSYGGYMTSTIVTKTKRFKAAMVGAGVTNLISFTGTADIPSFIPDYFGGEFWDRTESYMTHSAMFAIKNVVTPSLVIHGEQDDRVPISQGKEFYVALKRLGVKTEMVTYPRTPHGPQEPKFIQDIGERTIAWFNQYLRGTTPALRSER